MTQPPEWLAPLARTAADVVRGEQRRDWPDRIPDWRKRAAAFDSRLHMCGRIPIRAGCFVNGLIVAGYDDRRRKEMLAAVCHEVAEAALVSECEPPFCYPADELPNGRHRVAEAVARLFILEMEAENETAV